MLGRYYFLHGKKHIRRIKEKYVDELRDKTIICLNVPDEFEYMDEDLQDILKSCTEEYI